MNYGLQQTTISFYINNNINVNINFDERRPKL